MLVIKTDRQNSRSLSVPVAANRYTLTTTNFTDKTVMLNGAPLQLGAGDAFPMMVGRVTVKGTVSFAPASITFLVAPFARNQACR